MANYDSNTSVVKQVQVAVNTAGYKPALTVDGKYGNNTAAGVKWFQKQHGLTVDGVIGDATVAATGPTPPGHDPVAGLLASIATLTATQATVAAGGTPTLPASVLALVAPPVPSTSVPTSPPAWTTEALQPTSLMPGGSTLQPAAGTPAPAAGAPAPAAGGTTPPAPGVAATAPFNAAEIIPAGLGLVLGAGLGALISIPIGIIIGAVAGAGAGLGYSALTKLAPVPAIHGESDFGFDMDYGSEPEITACEIGCPTTYVSVRG